MKYGGKEMETKKRNFYNLAELQELLDGQVSRIHLYNLVKRGEIPSCKFGKRLLIPASYVHTLINLQTK
jgi:excisionase family DNA binding protein